MDVRGQWISSYDVDGFSFWEDARDCRNVCFLDCNAI